MTRAEEFRARHLELQKSADATGDQFAKEFFQEAANTWGASR